MKYIIFDVFKNDPLLEPPYSMEEDTKNLTYIERVRKDHDPPYFRSLLLGNGFWKEAVESKHMLGRSFSSLKNRYKKLCESAVLHKKICKVVAYYHSRHLCVVG